MSCNGVSPGASCSALGTPVLPSPARHLLSACDCWGTNMSSCSPDVGDAGGMQPNRHICCGAGPLFCPSQLPTMQKGHSPWGSPRGCDMQGEAASCSRRALSHWQEGHEVTLQLPQSHGIPPLFLDSPFPPCHPSSMVLPTAGPPPRMHLLDGGVGLLWPEHRVSFMQHSLCSFHAQTAV